MPGGDQEIEIIYEGQAGGKGGKGNSKNKVFDCTTLRQSLPGAKENSSPSLQVLKKPFFIRSFASDPFPHRPNWNRNGKPHNK